MPKDKIWTTGAKIHASSAEKQNAVAHISMK